MGDYSIIWVFLPSFIPFPARVVVWIANPLLEAVGAVKLGISLPPPIRVDAETGE